MDDTYERLVPLSEVQATGEFKLAERPNPWARISDVAARVGVQPVAEDVKIATISAQGADGKWYDVWEVITAVLDRLEEG